MAKFNPEDYETVDARIRRFKKDWEDSQIVTELVDMSGNVRATRWVVKASIWRTGKTDRPDATGYAFEVDGDGMANKTSALENGETSAIGRALANLGYSGDKRASREEMEKVQREEDRQADLQDWANKLLAFEQQGNAQQVQAGLEWARKAGDREKFNYAQGIAHRMSQQSQEPQQAGDAVDQAVTGG